MIFNLFKFTGKEKSKQQDWSKKILLFSIIIILVLTLVPFDFEDPKENYIRAIFTRFGHHSDGFDLFGNLLLFIPFGFGFAGVLEKRKVGFWKTAIVATISSLLLSTTVEVLQVFLPERSSTSIDIISNTTSGFLGFLIFQFGKNTILNLVLRLSAIGRRWLNLKWAIAIFLSYLIAVIALLFSLQDVTKPSNWDASYPLLVGNEQTGDRAWKGNISQFCIADRAVSKIEVDQLLKNPSNCDNIADFLVASYVFSGNKKSYPDRTRNLPDLISQGTLPKKETSSGVFLNYKHWLKTAKSVKLLTEKVQTTSQLTLFATIATADSNQSGPARIISLSKNPISRNLTLGQEGNDLSFRLRTPLTGENGDAPESIVPKVFTDTEFHRIAILYDGWTLKIYVDKLQNIYQISLSPDAALFWSVMSVFDRKIHLNPSSLFVYKIFYYGIIFVPLGLLFAIVWVSYRGNWMFSLLVIVSGILLPAFLVEGVIASCMERSLQLSNIGLSVALESIAILSAKNELSAWLLSTQNESL